MNRSLLLALMTLSSWLSAQIVVDPLETCAGEPVQLDASGLASAGASGINVSALQFGSGDYMRIPITAALSDFQEVTIEFWYYQISRGEEFIVATECFATGWGFHNENPNVMQWRVEGGPYSLGGSTYPIPYNQWMHVAGVYDGSELRLYVDGTLIASEAFSGPLSDSRNEDIVVNRHVWASGSSSRLTGYLDELRISGVARYSDNFTPPAFDFLSDDQTLGLWHFDTSTGLMLDDSGYGHHGTSSGTGSTSVVPYASYDTNDDPSYLWSNGVTSPTIDVVPQAQETFVVTVTQGDQVVIDSVVVSPNLTCCPGPGCCLDGTVWDFDLGGCVMEEPPFLETGGAYASVNPCYFDSNDDGLVEVADLMNLLSVYNLTCGELPESAPWQCGDPLGYQGYDYQTVQIGGQCWFAENLRATQTNAGAELIWAQTDSAWQVHFPSQAYCIVEGCSEGADVLYSGTVADNSVNLCPTGWHIPTDAQWKVLELTLGMLESDAELTGWRGENELVGGQLKSNSSFWTEPNVLSASSGFNAQPCGYRAPDGTFDFVGSDANFWNLKVSATNVHARALRSAQGGVFRNNWDSIGGTFGEKSGRSVRCVQDGD